MEKVILLSLASSLAINAALFVIAYRLQSDKLTDISYAISFVTIDIVSLLYAHNLTAFNWIIFAMVALWAVRIGGFLLRRVLTVGKDRRFDELRSDPIKFGKFWLGQAVTAWVLMLPVTLGQYRGGDVSTLVRIGVVIWLIGLLIEAAADQQKFAFKQNSSNKGKWIESGVWKYSRHPNYFGEISVWVGVYIACYPALSGVQRIICLASPVLITLVLRYVSGIPILEKNADERWGGQKAYQDYKRRTNLLVPLPKIY